MMIDGDPEPASSSPSPAVSSEDAVVKEEEDPNASATGSSISGKKKDADGDEAAIHQILHFWNHPSLQDVSVAQKLDYLKQKGIDSSTIFKAWDHILQQPTASNKKTTTPSQSDFVSSFQAQQRNQQPPPQGFPAASQQPATASNYPNVATPFNSDYQNHPHYSSYDYDPADDMMGGPSANSVALIATVGGFLGLLAAATVRWLNGGDFLLFPPPNRDSGEHKAMEPRLLTLQQERSQDVTEEEEEDEEEAEEEEEEASEGDPELARYLSSASVSFGASAAVTKAPDVMQHAMAQITGLSETLQQHLTVQQRILQKLTTSSSSSAGGTMTDVSMKLLRQQQQKQQEDDATVPVVKDPLLWYKLVEIQVELAALKRDWQGKGADGSSKLEEQLGETLNQLQDVLKTLQPKPEKEHDSDNHQKDASPSTSIEESTEHNDKSPSTNNNQTETEQPESPAETETTSMSMKDDQESKMPVSNNETNTDSEGKVVSSSHIEATEATIVKTVRKAFIDLVRQNAEDPTGLKTGVQMLFLYINNLSKNPHVPRYRKIFTSNESYKKVDRLQGGRDFLSSLGFVLSADERVLEWPPPEPEADGTEKTLTVQDKEKLVETYHLVKVVEALTVLKSISPQSSVETTTEETMSLLEKALDVLPCPPPEEEP
ncbi:expressed unknown protein [Seminavis robusta]|uniref:PUB domain-containing protein n=1 Tax=Seminavis robusta TaxID=568900 RepID=A0A9N8H554_9STRA|nr:expressed unknown protein [Seminavis robusta]|eukprot:Sro104_g052690.1 n/a (659) ;mRNA; r:20604-22580